MATSPPSIPGDRKQQGGNGLQQKLLDPDDSNGSKKAKAFCTGCLDGDLKSSLRLLVIDMVGSAIFWYCVPFLLDNYFYTSWCSLLAAMILWRVFRCRQARRRLSSTLEVATEEGCANADTTEIAVPYTVGFAKVGDQELYLVATVHISPRSAADAKDVVDIVRPNVVMIELDEERLDSMRPKKPQPAKPEDLQPIIFRQEGGVVPEDGSWWWPFRSSEYQAIGEEGLNVLSQRALWNAEWCGKTVAGEVFYDSGNHYGVKRPGAGARGSCVLVHRGGPVHTPTRSDCLTCPHTLPSFVNKAHIAARDGAVALLVINVKEQQALPAGRIGTGSLGGELQVACHTCSMSFPPIPVLLLDYKDGDRLRYLAEKGAEAEPSSRIRAEFKVVDDKYPRKTLRRELCQSCAMFFSGIGILYGIIRCFKVEVGAEFWEAEAAALRLGVPCVCIDVDIQKLCGTIAQTLLPTPCNLFMAAWSWMALPRCLIQAFFPPEGNIDHLGSLALHAVSFRLRTWIAFIIAGLCAGQVTSHILKWFSGQAADVTEHINPGVGVKKNDLQIYIALGLQMYILPCIYSAILASRDEAMYLGIAKQARTTGARRMVAVAGAAHTNGILQRCRDRGFGQGI